MALESFSLSMPQQESKKAKTHSAAVRFCLFALYSTIEAAASGNVDAINAVLKHYERYTPALNALKALRGVPISMGRGETPVGCCQPPSGFANNNLQMRRKLS